MAKHKHGKSRQKQQSPANNPLAPITSGTQPAPIESETDKRQNRRIKFSLWGVGVGFLLNALGLYFAFSSAESSKKSAKEATESNKISQAAQDRGAGKVQARFEFLEDKNRDQTRLKDFVRKKDGYEQQVLRIESVDELIRWGPNVRIKNTGTEPIDAIKTEVNYVLGSAYGAGVEQIYPPPIIVNEVSSNEASSFGKLMLGESARIDLAPLLLHQISRLNWQDFAEKDHQGIFTVSVYSRLVGSASYDRMEPNRPKVLEFHWRPAGFKNDAKHVKELLDIKPSVKIE